MICRKATFTVSVSAVTLSNAILRLPAHKTSILCSKGLKMRVFKGKSAQKCHFCARGWLPRAQQRCHEPCGVHLAAVRQATDCRNLPRNLPRACRRAYYREQAARLPAAAYTAVALPPRSYHKKATAGTPVAVHAAETCRQDLPAAHTTVHTAVALPPRRYRKKLPSCATAEELPPCNLPAGAYYRAMGPAPSGRVIRM